MMTTKIDVRPRRLPLNPSFSNAGYTATFYDTNGEMVLERDVPMLRIKDVEAKVVRDESGVPLEDADFRGITPLLDGVEAAGQVRVLDIRRNSTDDYDVREIDDDPERWILVVSLKKRFQPIGVR